MEQTVNFPGKFEFTPAGTLVGGGTGWGLGSFWGHSLKMLEAMLEFGQVSERQGLDSVDMGQEFYNSHG